MNDQNKTCEERISGHLEGRAEDFRAAMAAKDLENVSEDVGNFYDYGLDFSYVEPNTFGNQKTGYYRYQLSWGGPSDEIRFYQDGKIEYSFMDWYDGAVKEITNLDWAQWVKDYFAESIDWDAVEIY